MTIYRIKAIRTDNGATYDMGNTTTKAKMKTFRTMQEHGDKIIELFDCEDLEPRWENKFWFFYNGKGEKVGNISIQVDDDAMYTAKLRAYKEQKAAYEAQERMNAANLKSIT